MKKGMSMLFWAMLTISLFAQTPEPYEFKEYKNLPATPVKSQDQTGTCWAFSTTSFLESEAIRMKKGEHNLSEMFTVRNIYRQKCENYVRRLGKAQLSEGGLAHDKLNAVREFGVVPESVYPGRKDPAKPYNHAALEKQLISLCDGFVEQAKKGELAENWIQMIDKTLDEEFGPAPIQFNYNNTVFTPTSFRDYLGLNPDDYVNITSFSHHPFWKNFILEVPDNFSNGQFFNMPLGDLIRCLNHSLQQGYTVEWDADVSNPGFGARYGLAVVPEADWKKKDKDQIASTFKYWEPEKPVDQKYRQQLFDRLETQDDHLMHIVGMLNETHSGIYYVVKNSWGEISDKKGFVYVSEPYMRLNTISFTVNKKSLPRDIRQRMGLERGDPNAQSNSDAGASPGPATQPDGETPAGASPSNGKIQPSKPRVVPLAKPQRAGAINKE